MSQQVAIQTGTVRTAVSPIEELKHLAHHLPACDYCGSQNSG